MATTTNFSWETPDDTDLVKDGAAAIRTLGNSIDTSFVDLKGGTTGQVLAKASNTDLDYTWTSPNPGDITAVTAGTGITGGGTSGDVTVSFDQANYGGGQFAAGKNKVINGDFNIWQRGTTFTSPATASYSSDRWRFENNGTGTVTISQQAFTAGAAPVAGYESSFFLRLATTAVGTTTNFDMTQRIENVTTFANQTVTLSFFAKADSARTVTPIFGQGFGSGGSSSVFTAGSAITLTTSWARYTATITIPSISGKTIGANNFLQVFLRSVAAASSVIDYWGVQVEAGSVATPFQTATGTLQGELAACQRYYYRFTPSAAANRYGAGFCDSTTIAEIYTNFPVQMRTRPTALEQSGTATDYSVRTTAAGVVNCSAVPQIGNASEWGTTTNLTVASGLTSGNGALGRAVNTNAYLGWSAEL